MEKERLWGKKRQKEQRESNCLEDEEMKGDCELEKSCK